MAAHRDGSCLGRASVRNNVAARRVITGACTYYVQFYIIVYKRTLLYVHHILYNMPSTGTHGYIYMHIITRRYIHNVIWSVALVRTDV